ncbi:MCP four helix bundle domain-containing protein [Pedobacter sp. PLR]|uniref:MCP four helix bundle domain-containing protein n=1 Tax=Pedobacter sp. PLR TaxID=2994465 RepID=UPI00224535DF|nr:MCP four helix bundle domain-containing protein [Pedobacter sp. PLR]MCX2449668.1 MCP four helix bundle domain-containing protein [Pedobacter sp. PLR]
MKIKTKLRLAFAVLFAVVLSFGGISLYYMNKIASGSKNILKDNYESLNYLGKMRKVLDENVLPLSSVPASQFRLELEKERNNITEKGEREAVLALSQAYETIVDPASNITAKQEALNKARLQIRIIEELNMNAVIRKNTLAQEGVQKAATYLVLAASFCFLLLFSLVVNLPDLIAKSQEPG